MPYSHGECEHETSVYARHICRNGRKYHADCEHPQIHTEQSYCDHLREFPECTHGPGKKALTECTRRRKREAKRLEKEARDREKEAEYRAHIEREWKKIQEEKNS